jgi:hypothetical protein
MLTGLAWTLLSIGLWLIVFRLVERADRRRRPIPPAPIVLQVYADYETLRRLGAEAREREEIERLERAYQIKESGE